GQQRGAAHASQRADTVACVLQQCFHGGYDGTPKSSVNMRRMRNLVLPVLILGGAIAAAQQPTPPAPAPLQPFMAVRPIAPPGRPLPGEAESAGVTRFSFFAYGDTRSGSDPNVPGDGQIIHPVHNQLVDQMVAKARELASTPFPVRFVVQSGDAVLRGA